MLKLPSRYTIPACISKKKSRKKTDILLQSTRKVKYQNMTIDIVKI